MDRSKSVIWCASWILNKPSGGALSEKGVSNRIQFQVHVSALSEKDHVKFSS